MKALERRLGICKSKQDASMQMIRHPHFPSGRRQRHTSRLYRASKEGDIVREGSHAHLRAHSVQRMYIVSIHVSAGDLCLVSC